MNEAISILKFWSVVVVVVIVKFVTLLMEFIFWPPGVQNSTV